MYAIRSYYVKYRRNILKDSQVDLNMKLYMPTPNEDIAVITSYSIHYTKLYDGVAEGYAPDARTGAVLRIRDEKPVAGR